LYSKKLSLWKSSPFITHGKSQQFYRHVHTWISCKLIFKIWFYVSYILGYFISITSTSCLVVHSLFYTYTTNKHIVVKKLVFMSKLAIGIKVVANFLCNHNDQPNRIVNFEKNKFFYWISFYVGQ
jgi:hypothetical protein